MGKLSQGAEVDFNDHDGTRRRGMLRDLVDLEGY